MEVEKFLNMMFERIAYVWNMREQGITIDPNNFEVDFIFDRPVNEMEEVQKFQILVNAGLSKYDALKQLSFIEDVDAALNRIDEEREKTMGEFGNDVLQPENQEEEENVE